VANKQSSIYHFIGYIFSFQNAVSYSSLNQFGYFYIKIERGFLPTLSVLLFFFLVVVIRLLKRPFEAIKQISNYFMNEEKKTKMEKNLKNTTLVTRKKMYSLHARAPLFVRPQNEGLAGLLKPSPDES